MGVWCGLGPGGSVAPSGAALLETMNKPRVMSFGSARAGRGAACYAQTVVVAGGELYACAVLPASKHGRLVALVALVAGRIISQRGSTDPLHVIRAAIE